VKEISRQEILDYADRLYYDDHNRLIRERAQILEEEAGQAPVTLFTKVTTWVAAILLIGGFWASVIFNVGRFLGLWAR